MRVSVLSELLLQRLVSVGCRFFAEHALMPRLAPILPAEVPKASLAGLTSAEETKIHEINKSHLIKVTQTCY